MGEDVGPSKSFSLAFLSSLSLDKDLNFPILMSRFNTAVSLYNNMKGWNRGYRRPVVA